MGSLPSPERVKGVPENGNMSGQVQRHHGNFSVILALRLVVVFSFPWKLLSQTIISFEGKGRGSTSSTVQELKIQIRMAPAFGDVLIWSDTVPWDSLAVGFRVVVNLRKIPECQPGCLIVVEVGENIWSGSLAFPGIPGGQYWLRIRPFQSPLLTKVRNVKNTDTTRRIWKLYRNLNARSRFWELWKLLGMKEKRITKKVSRWAERKLNRNADLYMLYVFLAGVKEYYGLMEGVQKQVCMLFLERFYNRDPGQVSEGQRTVKQWLCTQTSWGKPEEEKSREEENDGTSE